MNKQRKETLILESALRMRELGYTIAPGSFGVDYIGEWWPSEDVAATMCPIGAWLADWQPEPERVNGELDALDSDEVLNQVLAARLGKAWASGFVDGFDDEGIPLSPTARLAAGYRAGQRVRAKLGIE